MLLTKLFLFLEDVPQGPQEPTYSAGWYIVMTMLLVVLVAPWVYLIFKYGIFRKLRIRYILSEGEELPPVYLKKNEPVVIPEDPLKDGYKFEGWYLDDLFMHELPKNMLMPNQNVKLYAKFTEVKEEEETK